VSKRWTSGLVGALFGVLVAAYWLNWKDREMATRRKPWPYSAQQARDSAIMELTIAVRNLRRLVEDGGSLSNLEQLRCEAIALSSTTNALRELEAVVDRQ